MTQVSPPLLLDDDWEPPPHPPSRLPALITTVVLLVAGALFVSIQLGVWEQDGVGAGVGALSAQPSQPVATSRSHRLWYPDSDAIGPRGQLAHSPVASHPPAPHPATPRPVAPRPVAPRPVVPRPAARAPQVVRAAPPIVPGHLSVNSTPWAKLSLDGSVVGTTPRLNIGVLPGRHQLVLWREGFAPETTWVNVAPGAAVRITGVVLKPKASQ